MCNSTWSTPITKFLIWPLLPLWPFSQVEYFVRWSVDKKMIARWLQLGRCASSMFSFWKIKFSSGNMKPCSSMDGDVHAHKYRKDSLRHNNPPSEKKGLHVLQQTSSSYLTQSRLPVDTPGHQYDWREWKGCSSWYKISVCTEEEIYLSVKEFFSQVIHSGVHLTSVNIMGRWTGPHLIRFTKNSLIMNLVTVANKNKTIRCSAGKIWKG